MDSLTEKPVAASPTTSSEGDVQRLLELIEADELNEARSLLDRLLSQSPESEQLRYLAEVLAPPEEEPVENASNQSFRREQEWLKKHSHQYPNCWLSVYEGRLLAADPDLHTVSVETRQKIGSKKALIHFQPDSSA